MKAYLLGREDENVSKAEIFPITMMAGDPDVVASNCSFAKAEGSMSYLVIQRAAGPQRLKCMCPKCP
jgi:hypothetical protein